MARFLVPSGQIIANALYKVEGTGDIVYKTISRPAGTEFYGELGTTTYTVGSGTPEVYQATKIASLGISVVSRKFPNDAKTKVFSLGITVVKRKYAFDITRIASLGISVVSRKFPYDRSRISNLGISVVYPVSVPQAKVNPIQNADEIIAYDVILAMNSYGLVNDVVTPMGAQLLHKNVWIQNYSHGGFTIPQLQMLIPVEITPNIHPNYKKNILVFNELANSFGGGGSAATVFAALKSYCNEIKAFDPTIIIIMNKMFGISGVSDAIRNSVNGMIDAEVSPPWDRVVDTMGDTFMMSPSANPQFAADFPDGTHLSYAANLRWVNYMVTDINTLL
jgi:hypothetical protein